MAHWPSNPNSIHLPCQATSKDQRRREFGPSKKMRVSWHLKDTAMDSQLYSVMMGLFLLTLSFLCGVEAWTGEIHGRVVCDVCGDSSIGPEDHVLEGAEVAVLCITKSGEVLNYQAFTNANGVYTVAETMPESDRWDACLARPISSFHEHCTNPGQGNSGVKFTYNRPSGYFHTVRPFVYRPANLPTYCI